MSYDITCISSRATTDQALDRAKRLITVLANPFVTGLGNGGVRLFYTGTPFEKEVAKFFNKKFGRGKTVLITHSVRKSRYMSTVRTVHPKPTKLSKKAFMDLCTVAEAVDKCHVLIAVPIKKERGRAVIAMKMAAYSYLPFIDLSTDEAEERITKQEANLQKKSDQADADIAYQKKLRAERQVAKIAKRDAFFEALNVEMDNKSILDENIRETIRDEAGYRYDDNRITSPTIHTYEVSSLPRRDSDGNTVIVQYLHRITFEDEIRIDPPAELPSRRREPRVRRITQQVSRGTTSSSISYDTGTQRVAAAQWAPNWAQQYSADPPEAPIEPPPDAPPAPRQMHRMVRGVSVPEENILPGGASRRSLVAEYAANYRSIVEDPLPPIEESVVQTVVRMVPGREERIENLQSILRESLNRDHNNDMEREAEEAPINSTRLQEINTVLNMLQEERDVNEDG